MTEPFLTLFIPDQQVMLPTHQLVEVLSLQASQLSPIPDTPHHVMGVTNWRGEVLWVMDLSALMGLAPLYNDPMQLRKFPVVIVFAHELTIGLAIVRVGKMIQCDPTEFRSDGKEMEKFGQGVWISPNRETFLVLSAEKLIQVPTLEPAR